MARRLVVGAGYAARKAQLLRMSWAGGRQASLCAPCKKDAILLQPQLCYCTRGRAYPHCVIRGVIRQSHFYPILLEPAVDVHVLFVRAALDLSHHTSS